MPGEGSDTIPGVDTQQLADVAGLLPELPNIRAEPVDRFVQGVRRLAETRAQRAWPNEGDADCAVFVMVDHPRLVGEKHGAEPFTDLVATDDPLLGKLFFATRDASRGQVRPLPADPNAILNWIGDRGLGNCPIVTVYRKSKMMVTRRAGADDDAMHDPIRDQKPSATLEELREALTFHHLAHLLTPTCCPDGVWERNRAHQYVPGKRPERSIQRNLQVVLGSWFHGIVVAEGEDDTNIGRIDVRLLTRDNQGALTYWVIMELKVIKSFRNAPEDRKPSPLDEGDNVSAIAEGVLQAGSYGKNRGTKGLLEIFDLRKNKSPDLTRHGNVVATMKMFTPSPEIHVWPAFGSAQEARKAGFHGAYS